MIKINMILAEAERFRRYLPGLSDPLPPGSIGLTAELDDGLFAGTALVISHPRSGTGSISVLHVPEMFRTLGIGSRLLVEAERQLIEAGCRTVRVTLTMRKGEPCPEKDFLIKRGYASEKLQIRSYTFRSASAHQEPWLERFRLPEGSELKPLLSATAEEREELRRIAASLPPDLHPFEEERMLHPEFSTMLKIDGKVAGWLGVQQLASNLLLLRSMHVGTEYRIRGNGMALFAELNRKHRLLDRFAYHMMSISGDNQTMLRLAERKLAPHAAHIKSVIRLEKRL